jgi:hypothetical protein
MFILGKRFNSSEPLFILQNMALAAMAGWNMAVLREHGMPTALPESYTSDMEGVVEKLAQAKAESFPDDPRIVVSVKVEPSPEGPRLQAVSMALSAAQG